MKAQVFSDGGPESLRQIEIVKAVAARFALEVEILPAGGDAAAEAGIVVPPGLAIDGITLAIGRALSAGRIRRFIESARGA